MHQGDPLGRGALPDQGPQHRPPGPKGALPAFHDLQVGGEQVVQGRTAFQQAADLAQVGVQFAQGADQFQAGDGVDVVQAVARLGQARGFDDSGVGVEADGADAQPAAARGVSDGVGLVVIHGDTVAPQAT